MVAGDETTKDESEVVEEMVEKTGELTLWSGMAWNSNSYWEDCNIMHCGRSRVMKWDLWGAATSLWSRFKSHFPLPAALALISINSSLTSPSSSTLSSLVEAVLSESWAFYRCWYTPPWIPNNSSWEPCSATWPSLNTIIRSVTL